MALSKQYASNSNHGCPYCSETIAMNFCATLPTDGHMLLFVAKIS